MNRTVKDKKTFQPKPVEKIELDSSRLKLKTVLFVILVVVAVLGITFGFIYLLRTESGWAEVTVTRSDNPSCADEFSFVYYYEDRSALLNAEARAVTEKYTALCEKCFSVFDIYEDRGDNIGALNARPNTDIKTDALLYSALKKATANGNRAVFGAPVQAIYNGVCSAESDFEAELYDPDYNSEIKTFIDSATAYLLDNDHVDLKFSGGDTVRLYASDEYLRFLNDNGVELLIDLNYLKNAFIIDYIAEQMTAEGFDKGVISSVDGYTRTFCDTPSSLSILGETDGKYLYAATAEIDKKCAALNLRAAPQSGNEKIYIYENGKVTLGYFDIASGVDKCACTDLFAYSYDLSCTDIALCAFDVWIADALDTEKLTNMKNSGVDYVYFNNGFVHKTGDVNVEILEGDTSFYLLQD